MSRRGSEVPPKPFLERRVDGARRVDVQRFRPRRHVLRNVLRALMLIAAVAAISVGALFYVGLRAAESTVAARRGEVLTNFSLTLRSMSEPDRARGYLEQNAQTLAEFDRELKGGQGGALLEFFSMAVPIFRDAGGIIGQLVSLNGNLLRLMAHLADLGQHGFSYLIRDGAELLNLLDRFEESVGAVLTQAQSIKHTTSELKRFSPSIADLDEALGSRYVAQTLDFLSLKNFLGGIRSVLGADAGAARHVLVLFEDVGQARPGGGKIVAYADLELRGGQIEQITTQGIGAVEGVSAPSPDLPLPPSVIGKEWRVADSEWYFHFPASAQLVLNRIENALSARGESKSFEGVVAVNTHLLEAVLDAVGPVSLEPLRVTVDRDSVRADSRGAGVLENLVPKLVERLQKLSEADGLRLMGRLGELITARDVRFYARDPNIVQFLASTMVDGAVYDLPNGFWGSYLAFSTANLSAVDGALVQTSAEVQIDIDTSGSILTDLTISSERRDLVPLQGNKPYRAYVQVFMNPGSQLVSIEGNDTDATVPGSGNVSSSTEEGATTSRMERSQIFLTDYQVWTGEAFGKTVLGAWFSVPPSKQRTLEVRYQSSEGERQPLAPGKTFTFVYERASGFAGNVSVSVVAPLGYVWQENGRSPYLYTIPGTAGRTILYLTLSKR